jgi:hypothetical protein
MATSLPQFLYMLDEDLYRLGNATSPTLQNVRPQDVDSYENNGIQMVYANGKGVSLFNLQELQRRESGLSGWVWKIPQGTPPPSGIALRPDPASPGHFFLCPVSVMTMDRYRALLSELVLHCERTRKI